MVPRWHNRRYGTRGEIWSRSNLARNRAGMSQGPLMLRARGNWWSIIALNFLYAPGDPANLLMLCQEMPKSLAVKSIGWRLSFEGGGRPLSSNGVFRIKTPKFGGKFQ